MPRSKKNARPAPKPFKLNYDKPNGRPDPNLDPELCQKVEPPQKPYLKLSRVKQATANELIKYPEKQFVEFECEQHWHYREQEQ